MPHALFTPEARLFMQEGDSSSMKQFCDSIHPATVAEALAEDFTVEEIWKFISTTDIPTQATIFEYFPIEQQVALAEGTGQPHMARLIEQMSSDDRAELVRRLEPRVREALLRLVDEADRKDIAALSRYEEGTAGAMMTTNYAWLPSGITVAEAFEQLNHLAPDSETIYYAYVLSKDRTLLGLVTLRKLVLAQRNAKVDDIMKEDLILARAGDDQEQVARTMSQYDLLAIPVVDEFGHLLGIVTHDDAVDVLEQAATEDAQHQGGTLAFDGEYLKAPFFTIWRKRVVWLACLFIAELLTFSAMEKYEKAMDQVLVLAMFVPLIISTGGNSGSQAATLITRAMALGQVSLGEWFKVFRKEFLMGLALAAALGSIAYARVWITGTETLKGQVTHADLAITIAMAVLAICVLGTLVGAMLPFVFQRLGFDPAFASSPFVATLVDVSGIIIFFNIALIWIPVLRGG